MVGAEAHFFTWQGVVISIFYYKKVSSGSLERENEVRVKAAFELLIGGADRSGLLASFQLLNLLEKKNLVVLSTNSDWVCISKFGGRLAAPNCAYQVEGSIAQKATTVNLLELDQPQAIVLQASWVSRGGGGM